MKNFKELKQSVSPRMKRCWGECCALFFISAGGITAGIFAWFLTTNYLLAMDIINSMNDPMALLAAVCVFLIMWIISVPYRYGSRWYRLQQVRGHAVHAKSVFSCYFSSKRLFQIYKLSASLTLRKSPLIVVMLLLVGAAIFYIIRFGGNEGAIYGFVSVVLIMILVVVYLMYTIINIKYTAAPYLFALGHDRPVKDIIKESVTFTKSKHGYMIEILRSCALMLIPCIFVFPMIFVIPKMMMIYTAAINEMIENGFAEDRLVGMERRE